MEQKILKSLEKTLRKSVKECLGKEKKVAVVFSGGIDSSLIAFITHQASVKVSAFTVGFKDSPDIQFVQLIKARLPFRLVTKTFTQNDLKKILSTVKNLLEQAKIERNLIQTSLAAGLYLSLVEIKRDKLNLALSGQGADELFAGYNKFTTISSNRINKFCREEFQRALSIDYRRDQAVADYLQVRLKNPYLDSQVANLALKIPSELKVKKHLGEIGRKYILRKLGKKIGLPSEIVNRRKQAFQYSSRIQREIRKIEKAK